MRVLSTVPFTILRLLRGYIILLLLLVVPIALITVFAFILDGMVTETGEPYLNATARIMVVSFQLFGGSVTMSMIYYEFFTGFKLRLAAAPFDRRMYAFSLMMCSTLFSIVLGILLMVYTRFVLGVVWGNWLWAIYIVTLMSVLSSVVCLIFMFSVKQFKVAERLSELYGIGFIMLAGLFFPMPDNVFFRFMGSYGNPLTLSMMSIEAMNEANPMEAWIYASMLLSAIIVLFVVMLALGRRRLA